IPLTGAIVFVAFVAASRTARTESAEATCPICRSRTWAGDPAALDAEEPAHGSAPESEAGAAKEEKRQFSLAHRLVAGVVVSGLLAAAGWLLSPYVVWLSDTLAVVGVVLFLAVLVPAGTMHVARALGYGIGTALRVILSPVPRARR